jgi:aqualysin 1
MDREIERPARSMLCGRLYASTLVLPRSGLVALCRPTSALPLIPFTHGVPMRPLRLSLLGAGLLTLAACYEQPLNPAAQATDAEPVTSNQVSLGAKGRGRGPIHDQYIVVLANGANADSVAASVGGKPDFVYRTVLNGFVARMNPGQAQKLERHPQVRYIDQDEVVSLSQAPPPVRAGDPSTAATQLLPTWGIDRIDQRDLPLNAIYNYTTTGSGVRVSVLDTSIRPTHTEFHTSSTSTTARAFKGTSGFDAIGDGQNGNDCNGHGTHVAGTIAGRKYGVAKSARVYSVRVLDCAGNGTWSGVIAGIDWVTERHVKPAVVNMSLGGGLIRAVDEAVTRSITHGITYVLAAGNDNADACNFSPANVMAAITVGSTESTDVRRASSNWGSCLDIFAPGGSITSAWHTSNTAINEISGTSMAAPHVAGVAALFLQANTTATPGLVTDVILSMATPNKVIGAGVGSPNRLLHRLNGYLGGLGAWQAQPHGQAVYVAKPGWLRGYLRGTASTNFDLRLFRWDGAAWVQVAANTATSTNATINYNATPAWYYWEVRSASGGTLTAGSYDFFMRLP